MERHANSQAFHVIRRAGGWLEGGNDRSWCYGIDANAFGCKLHRQRACETNDGTLCGAVVNYNEDKDKQGSIRDGHVRHTKTGGTFVSGHGSSVDDSGSTLEMRQGKLGYGEHLQDVGLESAVDILEVNIFKVRAYTV